MKSSKLGGLVRKYWLLISLFIASHLLTAATVYGIIAVTNANLARDEANSKNTFAKLDSQIAQLKDQRVTKQKADHTAAAQAAQQSKAATSGGTAKITCVNGLTSHGDPSAIDVMVNKSHCLSPIDFAPSDLTTVMGATISTKAAPQFTALMNAAAAAGVPLSITSSYRSFSNQVATYNGWVAANGSTDAADTVSARPGYSEHQTGFAVDFKAGSCALECFLKTNQYTWLQQHAAEYGFIQRYAPGYEAITGYHSEAWHYRYVGTSAAIDMQSKGIHTLEEYWHIAGGDYPR